MNLRKTALQILNTLLIASMAFMIWRGASIITEVKSPLVVVLSASMDPGFNRGDLLFLTLKKDIPVKVNDICVFELSGRSIPIVHRVMKIHQSKETKVEYILTKGDSNFLDDRTLYDHGEMWIHKENIVGIVRGYIPYVGMVTIWMDENPWMKAIAIGIIGLYTLVS